ncbi:MAG: sensor histidine kinase, partial [Candidatus Heimdallarchaeota archaeon]
ETMLWNLLENAWKFTKNKTPAEITFGKEQKDGKTIYYVRDNGAGFNMNYKEKLFQVFQRLHSTKEFPGIGIGLANVRRIVKKHGGEIWAESKEGEGTTFYFHLD